MSNYYRTISLENGDPFALDLENDEVIHIKPSDNKDELLKEYPSKMYEKVKLQHIPDTSKDREVLYICGPSGSGKTYYANKYLHYLTQLHDEKKIFLFTPKDEDISIDIPDIIKIDLYDESILNDPISYKELEDSICFFDDFEGIENQKVKDMILDLINSIILCGRDLHIDCIIICHKISDGAKTSNFLNECDSLTFFPYSGSSYQIKTRLKNYYDFDKDLLKYVLNVPSRWCTIFNKHPRRILHENGVRLL